MARVHDIKKRKGFIVRVLEEKEEGGGDFWVHREAGQFEVSKGKGEEAMGRQVHRAPPIIFRKGKNELWVKTKEF